MEDFLIQLKGFSDGGLFATWTNRYVVWNRTSSPVSDAACSNDDAGMETLACRLMHRITCGI